MSYTLAAAAAASGLNKTTIIRAIKSGKVTGTKNELGEWQVEPAELHRVYPAGLLWRLWWLAVALAMPRLNAALGGRLPRDG
jgi:hypothetical protein